MADAEAVSSNFDVAAKSRAHYFAKKWNTLMSSGNNGTMTIDGEFYAGGSGVVMAVTSQILDENTHVRSSSLYSSSTPEGNRQGKPSSLKENYNVDHDRSEDSISKRAKGFMGGEKEVNVAAVLSGMGA